MWLDPPPFLDHHYTRMLSIVIRLCHESVGIIPIYLQVNIRSTYYRHKSTSLNKLFPAAITATSTLYLKNYGDAVHGYNGKASQTVGAILTYMLRRSRK